MAVSQPAIVLYDGVCNFCDASVRFVVAHDRARYFAFAAQQSRTGRRLMEQAGQSVDSVDTLVLIEGDRVSTRSTASLRIARRLGGLWPLLYGLILVPRPLRDAGYDWFAARRYRWFGRSDECLLPTPELRDRFLDAGEMT